MNDEITGLWIVVHRNRQLFFRMRLVKTMSGYSPGWSTEIEMARFFPTEAAAKAVIEEWGLWKIADASVVCPTEE